MRRIAELPIDKAASAIDQHRRAEHGEDGQDRILRACRNIFQDPQVAARRSRPPREPHDAIAMRRPNMDAGASSGANPITVTSKVAAAERAAHEMRGSAVGSCAQTISTRSLRGSGSVVLQLHD